jgi:hypothetical protein
VGIAHLFYKELQLKLRAFINVAHEAVIDFEIVHTV